MRGYEVCERYVFVRQIPCKPTNVPLHVSVCRFKGLVRGSMKATQIVVVFLKRGMNPNRKFYELSIWNYWLHHAVFFEPKQSLTPELRQQAKELFRKLLDHGVDLHAMCISSSKFGRYFFSKAERIVEQDIPSHYLERTNGVHFEYLPFSPVLDVRKKMLRITLWKQSSESFSTQKMIHMAWTTCSSV